MTKLALFPYLEKVKTMRCFWEMKLEPEVSTQFMNKKMYSSSWRIIVFCDEFYSTGAPAEGSKSYIYLKYHECCTLICIF